MERRLFCWVVGDPTYILVRVRTTDTVDDLKAAVKEKNSNALLGLNIVDFTIFKVSIPFAQIRLPGLQRREDDILQPGDEIGDVFPNKPSPKHVHVVVQPPIDNLLPRPYLSDLTSYVSNKIE